MIRASLWLIKNLYFLNIWAGIQELHVLIWFCKFKNNLRLEVQTAFFLILAHFCQQHCDNQPEGYYSRLNNLNIQRNSWDSWDWFWITSWTDLKFWRATNEFSNCLFTPSTRLNTALLYMFEILCPSILRLLSSQSFNPKKAMDFRVIYPLMFFLKCIFYRENEALVFRGF